MHILSLNIEPGFQNTPPPAKRVEVTGSAASGERGTASSLRHSFPVLPPQPAAPFCVQPDPWAPGWTEVPVSSVQQGWTQPATFVKQQFPGEKED